MKAILLNLSTTGKIIIASMVVFLLACVFELGYIKAKEEVWQEAYTVGYDDAESLALTGQLQEPPANAVKITSIKGVTFVVPARQARWTKAGETIWIEGVALDGTPISGTYKVTETVYIEDMP